MGTKIVDNILTGELDGEVVFAVKFSDANDDWMRAKRLIEDGKPEALQELEKMQNSFTQKASEIKE